MTIQGCLIGSFKLFVWFFLLAVAAEVGGGAGVSFLILISLVYIFWPTRLVNRKRRLEKKQLKEQLKK